MTATAQLRSRRGAHLLDAALTVVAADGLAGLSMRSVAAAAGTSLAQVQYYFHSKDELVRAAFSYVGDQFLSGLDDLPDNPSFGRLRQAIWLWLPLDSDRDKAARVWLAFTAAAAIHPDLAAESARLDADLRAWFVGELQSLHQSGDLNLPCDPVSTAAQLFGLIDGATLQSLVIPLEDRPQLVAHTIDSFLQHLAGQSDDSDSAGHAN